MELRDGASYTGEVFVCRKHYVFSQGIRLVGPATLKGNGAEIEGPHIFDFYVSGILIEGSDVTVKGVKLTGWGTGISNYDPYSAAPLSFTEIRVTGNRFEDNLVAVYLEDVMGSEVSGNEMDVPDLGNGIQIFRERNTLHPRGDNLVSGNTIHVRNISKGIFVGGQVSGEFFTHNTISGNEINYEGCRENSVFCGATGIEIKGLGDSVVRDNNILGFSGTGIVYSGERNEILDNEIKGLWGLYYYGTGIWDINSWMLSGTAPGNIVRGNLISAENPGDPGTEGLLNYEFYLGISWGGDIIEGNTFQNLGTGYHGYQMGHIFFPNQFIANNFLFNSNQVEDSKNTFNPLEARGNHFSDHTGADCSPSGRFCQNPYSWPHSSDGKPKADAWSPEETHLECRNQQCRLALGPGPDQCSLNADC